jgi:HTH-type transcriptional regulator, sugar sensing transcriptional regulator
MVVSTEVMDSLKSIGLNLYERKIYVALLAKGIGTAGEVSGIAKVPRSRSYDILESLAEKGFVVMQPSKPIRYIALDPSDALDRVQANSEVKHTESVKRLENMKKSPILSDLQKVFKNGFALVQPFEMTGTIKGRHSINQHVKSLLKQAKNSVTFVTTEKGLDDLEASHFNTLKKMSKKGIKIKVFAPLKDKKSKLKEVADLNHVESSKGRMVTIDNDHVVLSLTSDKDVHPTQDVAFWANSPHVVKEVFQPMFVNSLRK